MAKKLILGVATLAIILVLFAIYDATMTGSDVPGQAAVDFDSDALPRPTPTTSPGMALQVEGVAIPPGEGVEFEAFDERGRVRTRLRASRWAPLSDREFELTEAKVEVVLPRGQIAHIEADEGRIKVQPGGKRNLDPKSGWLKGHVHVYIDRTTREWREAHPDQAASEKRPDDLVHIWLDEVKFDLDLSRLDTKSHFRVQATEADIEGTGLTLRWNEPANRVEAIRIEDVERMELRRGGDLITFGVPGAQRDETARRRQSTAAMATARLEGAKGGPNEALDVTTPQASQLLANTAVVIPARLRPASRPALPRFVTTAPAEGALPDDATRRTLIQLARARKEKKEQITTYKARFEGPVTVERRSGLEELGRLTATDALELIFDFSSKRGEQTEATPTSRPAESDERSAEAAPEPAEESKPEAKIVLTCDGPFTLVPIVEPDATPTGKRFHVEVTGDPVVVEEKQGRAVGRRIVWEQETERIWLEGGAEEPAVLRTGDGRELTAEQVFLDNKVKVARIAGPGEMKDIRELAAHIGVPGTTQPTTTAPAAEGTGAPADFRISWTRSVDLKFGTVLTRVRNEAGTGFDVVSQEVLKRAVFRGDVVMGQTARSLTADTVELQFAPPRESGQVADTLKEIRADGNVVLRDDLSRIVCRRLHVEMTVDADGDNVPTVARAIGAVRAEQRETLPLLAQVFGAQPQRVVRWITADDRLVVRFAKLRRETEPFDLNKARQIAIERGHDPETIDWDKQRAKYEAGQTEVRAVAMKAFGDVETRDISDKSPMEVQAEAMKIEMPDGRSISTIHLDGTETRKASAAMGDYFLRGHTIDADLPAEQADVPGPGELTFVAAESLDGRRREDPVPVHITWTERMALRGQKHLAFFSGKVHGESEASTLDCDESLRIELVSLPPPPAVAEAVDDNGVKGLWLLRPFLDRSSRSSDPLRPYAGRFRKRISRLLATGNARVLSSDIEPGTKRLIGRTFITGPRLAVDLDEERLNVDGAGSLLIEDYRLPQDRRRMSGARATEPSGLMLGSGGLSGPSQTLIQWAGAMSFFVDTNVAAFDRDVQLTHRAGTEMVLLQDLARSMEIDTENLRHLEGRRAGLTAEDHLAVTFRRDRGRPTAGGGLDALGGTSLERFDASGNVNLTEGTRSLSGQRVTYNRTRDRVTVRGGRGAEALLSVEDEPAGQFLAWQGPVLYWTPSSNAVQFPGGRIVSSSR